MMKRVHLSWNKQFLQRTGWPNFNVCWGNSASKRNREKISSMSTNDLFLLGAKHLLERFCNSDFFI